MAQQKYNIQRIRGEWHVMLGARRDTQLTAALRFAIGKKAYGTQRKVVPFLQAFLQYRHFENEPLDAFVIERCDVGRERIEGFLCSLGYKVEDADREDGSMTVGEGTAKPATALASALKALTKIYLWLSRNGLRPPANPGKVDHWHLMSPAEKEELAACVFGDQVSYKSYRGTQFIVVDTPTYPLRMEDPIGLGARVLSAGRAFAWPHSIIDQVTVIDEDGARWVDTYDLTPADWGRSSGFGRTLWAPNKGSKGRRTKKIVISEATVQQLQESFDRDPRRPNFSEILDLFEAKDWAALEAIYLFPSKLGRPFSYHVFNNDYFRPAMEAYGITIASITTVARATLHRLRSARIQEECEYIFREGRARKQISDDLEQLREDVSIKSPEAFKRYWGPLQERRSEKNKAARSDARLDRRLNVEKGLPASTAVSDRPLSRVEIRLAERRR